MELLNNILNFYKYFYDCIIYKNQFLVFRKGI